jgi:hypothetical protein
VIVARIEKGKTMSKPDTFEAYFEALPAERKEGMERLRDTLRANLPDGFAEVLNYGFPSWVVPHSVFPSGYHVDPSLPLPFVSIASQKRHVAVYHMGLYASSSLLDWFVSAWSEHSKRKLDMGKSCIRFRKPDDIPHALLGDLCGRMSVQEWIDLYVQTVKR